MRYFEWMSYITECLADIYTITKSTRAGIYDIQAYNVLSSPYLFSEELSKRILRITSRSYRYDHYTSIPGVFFTFSFLPLDK